MAKLPITPRKLDKRTKRQLIRRSIIGGNILLLIAVAVFVMSNRSASQTVRANTLNSATTAAGSTSGPVDQLSSSQIALTAAQMANLPELTAIRNQADSDSLLLSVPPNDSTILAKPQIVATAEKSKADIIRYTTVAGDTVTNLSVKYGVTPSSIRWSNNIYGDSLTAGTKLVIPPVNGIVYTVKNGDTPASLATRFQADQNQIIVYNDAEVNGLTPGEQILIPNGSVALSVAFSSFYAASYGGNGYDFGYCTWYVANKIAVPTNWGNAWTWDDYARLTPGWIVSGTPIVGAIAQTDNTFDGHVAYVEAVNSDGTVTISEMNSFGYNNIANIGNSAYAYGGWGKVDYKDVSTSSYKYIYHG